MLSAGEFTVGAFGDATPLSLILPRNHHELAALIGGTAKGPMAVILSGEHAFHCFESAGNQARRGLIISGVGIEVDETSLLDGRVLGAAIRSDTRLVIAGRNTAVVLHADLPSAQNETAAFSRWQVVLGEGFAKRVLFKMDVTPKMAP